MLAFEGFDWDAGNVAKCTKHGVSQHEIETVFDRPVLVIPDLEHSVTEDRMRIIGRTMTGRHVFVVFTRRKRGGEFSRQANQRPLHASQGSREL